MSKPKTASEYLDRGCDKDDKRDSKGAIEDYTKAIELDPNYTEAYANRGWAKEELGDKEGAIADWQKAADLGDEEAAEWIQEEKDKSKIPPDIKSSHEESEEISIKEEEDQNIYDVLNSAQERLWDGDFIEAINAFNEVIEIDPEATTYYDLGSAYFGLFDYKNAIDSFTKSIEIDPSNPDSFFDRGLAKKYSSNLPDEFEEAIKDFKKVVEIDPNCAEAYSELGTIYWGEIGDDVEAMKYLDKAIELDQSNAYAYRCRSEGRRRLKDYEGALSDALKAYDIDPEEFDSLLLVKIASDYYELGRYKNAINLMDEEIENQKSESGKVWDEGLYKERGRAKKALGDLKGACEDWQKATEIGSEDAAELLKEHCQ